jgi:hypothetical protein
MSLADAVAIEPKAGRLQHHNLSKQGVSYHHRNFGFLLSGSRYLGGLHGS